MSGFAPDVVAVNVIAVVLIVAIAWYFWGSPRKE